MADTRACKVCGETKPESQFPWRKDNKKFRNECCSCWNKLTSCRRYGITLEEYDALLHSQGCRCAICKVHVDDIEHETFTRLVVDHDHRTGKVRGLLCSRCNVALGHFDDSTLKLSAAIDYLRQF